MIKLKKLAIILWGFVACISFAACGDDDEPSSGNSNSAALIGTWETIITSGDHTDIESVTFNADGSFVSTNDCSEAGIEKRDGKWSVDGKITEGCNLTLRFSDGNIKAAEAQVKDNKLIVKAYGQIYTYNKK